MQNLSLLGAWALFIAFLFVQGDPSLWFEPLSVGIVLAAPLALSCARRGVARTFNDVALAWSPAIEEAPPASLAPAAANLRSLGADALSVGVLFAFSNVIALLRSFSISTTDPTGELIGQFGALFVAPMAGLAIKILFFDLLAKRVEGVIFRLHDPASVD